MEVEPDANSTSKDNIKNLRMFEKRGKLDRDVG